MKIIIELPDDIALDIIKNAAQLRKSQNRAVAGQGIDPKAIDPKLPDEEYLAADIKNDIIEDHIKVVKATASRKASKEAEDLERGKLNPKKALK